MKSDLWWMNEYKKANINLGHIFAKKIFKEFWRNKNKARTILDIPINNMKWNKYQNITKAETGSILNW